VSRRLLCLGIRRGDASIDDEDDEDDCSNARSRWKGGKGERERQIENGVDREDVVANEEERRDVRREKADRR